MKGTFIIGKNNTLYKIRNNLITVKIRGSSNTVVNKFFNINDLFVYGNKNIVIVERFGKINCIKIFGNNNEIHINNKTFTRYLDYGEGNKFIKNRSSIASNNRLEHNNNTNRINNIFDKFEEKSYGNLPSPIKNENLRCSLCTKDFSEEEKVKICPCKTDVFHAGCLRHWIEHNMNSPKCPKCGHTINSLNLINLDVFDRTRRLSPSVSTHIQENNSERNNDDIHLEPVNHAPHVPHDRSDINEEEEEEEEEEEFNINLLLSFLFLVFFLLLFVLLILWESATLYLLLFFCFFLSDFSKLLSLNLKIFLLFILFLLSLLL
jgi:hypothetical protein